jgi:hypothetical protein
VGQEEKRITETLLKTAKPLRLKEEIKLRPAFVDEYLEADKNEKIWKKKKDEIKIELLPFLRENPLLEDIYIARPKGKPKYDPDKLYEWVVSQNLPPEVLEEITIKTIDTDKLSEIYKRNLIGLPPEDCYEVKEDSERLEIPANRRRKKDES